MENINIHINKKRSIPGQAPMHPESPFDKRFGFYGVVVDVHYQNNTVDVRSDSGRVFAGIRVASDQWVIIPQKEATGKNKDSLTGRRHLPPKDAYVLCFMPTGEPSSAVVLCSVFAYQDPNHAELRDGEEDNEYVDAKVDSGGWKFTHDIRTGTRKIQNSPKDGEETISFEVNQEEEGKAKIIFKFFENSIEFDEEKQGWKQEIKGDADLVADGKLTAAVTGDVKVTAGGKADVEAKGDLSYKSAASGMLEIGNSVATLGAMIGDLLQACVSFKSAGSPETHTAPDFSVAAAQIKAKWSQVFK
jgi:hypothetical protein